jgi:hypothetical protein
MGYRLSQPRGGADREMTAKDAGRLSAEPGEPDLLLHSTFHKLPLALPPIHLL